jgi:Acetokinase family
MVTTARGPRLALELGNASFPLGYGMTDAKPVLTLNSGSSSLKFGLYRIGSSRTEMLLSGEAESIGDDKGKFYAQDSRKNALLSETEYIPSQREAIIRIGRLLADSKMPAPAAIGHRIVHGGQKLRRAAAYSIGSVGHPLRTRAFPQASAGGVF